MILGIFDNWSKYNKEMNSFKYFCWGIMWRKKNDLMSIFNENSFFLERRTQHWCGTHSTPRQSCPAHISGSYFLWTLFQGLTSQIRLIMCVWGVLELFWASERVFPSRLTSPEELWRAPDPRRSATDAAPDLGPADGSMGFSGTEALQGTVICWTPTVTTALAWRSCE